jgi:2-phosphosulfolactate phosphatase
LAVRDAPLVPCASFAVAGATAHFLRSRRVEEVTFVITGDNGQAEEDLACAFVMVAEVEDSYLVLRRVAVSGGKAAR